MGEYVQLFTLNVANPVCYELRVELVSLKTAVKVLAVWRPIAGFLEFGPASVRPDITESRESTLHTEPYQKRSIGVLTKYFLRSGSEGRYNGRAWIINSQETAGKSDVRCSAIIIQC